MRGDRVGSIGETRHERRLSWDVVRVAAVLLVMLFHSTWVATLWHPELGERAFQWRYAVGASTLLVVSGYFAAVSVERRDALRWWLGRLFRLLPAFWAAVLVTAIVQRTLSRDGWWMPTWPDVGANLAMLWQWKPQTYPYVDLSYWTLPLQLSAFTAVLLVATWRGQHRGPRAAVFLWTALAIEFALWPIRTYTAWEPFRMVHDGLGWHRVHLFVIGVTVFLVQRGRVSRGHGAALIAVGLAAHHLQLQDLVTTPITAACVAAVYAAAVGPDWDKVIPEAAHRPVRWLAGISYGVYLTHFSLGVLVMRYLHELGASPGLQVLGLMATGILVGWALTVLVERPAYRFLCRLRDQRRPVLVVPTSSAPAPRRTRPPSQPVPIAVVVLATFFGAVLVLASLGFFEVNRHPAVTLAALCAFAALVTCRAPARLGAAFGVASVCWLLYNGLVIPEIGQIRWDSAADSRRIGLLFGAALFGIALNRLLSVRGACSRIDPGDDGSFPRR
ncbi:acyltransferase family protein [Yinghuangia sp. YIM S10712]|uniref:acyltransferase family protein n=1 Tax=Yinghuangia sp. YIM S10712 TaxID=3436930 RepID=UPI003F52D1CB